MVKILQKKWGLAAIVAAAIMGAGWGLTTQSGSELLANGSAILVKSWEEVFGAGGVNAQVAVGGTQTSPSVGPAALASSTPKVAACWGTEQQDLASLARLLQNSNAALADLAKKLAVASSACPTAVMAATGADTAVALSDTATLTGASAENIIPGQCQLSEAQDSSGPIVLNEIAWMGSSPAPGETATKAGSREWIELKNISTQAVGLNGWQIADPGGKLQIVFGAADMISAGGFYLLSRSGNLVGGVAPDKSYSGSLANSGGALAVFDANCGVSDFVDAAGGWPAGNNATKQTMERNADNNGGAAVWQTSAAPGGTPKAENSPGLAHYTVSVAIQGDGVGAVVSSPEGISCNTGAAAAGGSICSAQFAAGTALALTAKAGANTTFVNWSGGCSGSSKCALTVGGMVSVNATFHSGSNDEQSASADESSADAGSVPDAPSSTPSSASGGHLLIAQVQITGAASTNDFVKIYNPMAVAVDISGWKLRKKSSTGSDVSLREFPQRVSIAAGAYFTWANSAGGFAQSINADASSTQTLAADNSVALFDAAGALVDAVAWGSGANQYVEGIPCPTSPAANQVLARKDSNDGIGLVDTDNNSDDFAVH